MFLIQFPFNSVMDAIARTSCLSYSFVSVFSCKDSVSHTFAHPPISKIKLSPLKFQENDQSYSLVKEKTLYHDLKLMKTGKNTHEVHCTEEFDEALRYFKNELVIAHFSTSHSKYNTKILQFMEAQCRDSDEVKFLHVIMANESLKASRLFTRENIKEVPRFILYKNGQKIHEEAGFQHEKLRNSISYYGNNHNSNVIQLHCKKDLEKLVEFHKFDHMPILLYIGMENCNPCVKIYPSVLQLSRQMVGKFVFARVFGDENESCVEILREFGVFEVPTFLILKDGEICGRYVGSSSSKLVREMMRFMELQYQTRLLAGL